MPEKRRLRVPEETASLLKNLHPAIKRMIKAGLAAILSDPECGKPLKDDLKGLRSLKTGRFRIIYRPTRRGIIEIVAVGPRRVIYAETYRLIKKGA